MSDRPSNPQQEREIILAFKDEVDGLRAEVERLRAALEQAVDDFGEGHCVCEQTKQECIAALEAKP